MSNHTPGEWKVRGGFYIGIDGDPFSLAEVKSCNTVPADKVEEHRANAKLIAAAPELLAACVRMLTLMNNVLVTEDKAEALEMMHSAVKKATEENTHV